MGSYPLMESFARSVAWFITVLGCETGAVTEAECRRASGTDGAAGPTRWDGWIWMGAPSHPEGPWSCQYVARGAAKGWVETGASGVRIRRGGVA